MLLSLGSVRWKSRPSRFESRLDNTPHRSSNNELDVKIPSNTSKTRLRNARSDSGVLDLGFTISASKKHIVTLISPRNRPSPSEGSL